MSKSAVVWLTMMLLLPGPFVARALTGTAALSALSSRQGELEELIGRIEARYGPMRGMAAEFEQTFVGAGSRVRRETGRLFLQRPRMMRWEYDPKPGKLFIVNGREVWFYVPADREATHTDAQKVSDARFPFLFLLGNTRLRRLFRSISLAEQQSSSSSSARPGTRTLRLIPRTNASGLREVFLEVFTDGSVSRIRITDEAGAVSEVALSNVRENYVAPADAFQFRPPPGVTVRKLR
ncbi:MAG TPA: outer membrane lipoprotein chaperone LolA [Pyrinomonadaceae bacterium]|jgi:outer membrane lipoprotein carrier protein